MADKSFVLRLELENGQVVVKGLEDIGAKGDAAMKKVGDSAKTEASAGMRAMGAATNEAKQAVDGFANRLGPLGNVLKALGPAGLVAAAGIGLTVLAVKKAMDLSAEAASRFDELGDTANRLGTSAGELVKWQHALEDTAGSMDGFISSAEDFQGKIGALLAGVGKNKGVAQALDAIGLGREDFLGKSLEQRLLLIADGLSKIGDAAARAGIADKLGLRPMLPLLEQGAAGVEKLTGKYADMGKTVDEGVKSTGDMSDRLNHLKAELEYKEDNLFVKLGPVTLAFYQTLINIVDKTKELLQYAGIIERSNSDALDQQLAELEAYRGSFSANNFGGVLVPGMDNVGGGWWTNEQLDARIAELKKYREEMTKPWTNRGLWPGQELGTPGSDNTNLGGGDVPKLNATEKAALKAAEALRKLIETRRQWRDDPTAAGDRRKSMEDASDAVTAQVEAEIAKLDQSYQAAAAMAESFRGDFTDAIKYALLSGDVLGAGEQLAYALADRFASALADQIYDALIPSLFKKGSGGGLGGFLSSLFSGGGSSSLKTSFGTPYAWADGGDFQRGQWGLVGERGPELVRWGSSGTVIPADQSRAMMRGGTQVQLTVINKGAPAKVDVEQRPDGRGGTNIFATLTPIVRDIMKSETRKGSLDGAMRDRFGARPKTEGGQ